VPSRKQRRKREKLQRHEYEYVLETEDGEEVVEGPRVAEAKSAANGKAEKEPTGLVDRRGRPIQKPSLQRVLKRTAIFAPLIAVFILLTADGLTTAGLIFNVALLLAFFMPFSYMVDTFVYRMMLRRHEKDRAARKAS
jgi:predicted component of type VI protein secretion system